MPFRTDPPGTRRRPGFLRLAQGYVRRRIARGLDGLHGGGVDATRDLLAHGPAIFAANHVGWWDPLVLVALDDVLGTQGFGLMDRENLGRLPFFEWVGILPLDRSRAAGARADLRAAAALLDRPRRSVWIFPQGRMRPAHLRPLGFEPGVRLLARLAPEVPIVPVALNYLFREAPRPAALAWFGDPLPPGTLAEPDGVQQLEDAVASGLARIDAALEPGTAHPLAPLIAPAARDPQHGAGARLLGARVPRG